MYTPGTVPEINQGGWLVLVSAQLGSLIYKLWILPEFEVGVWQCWPSSHSVQTTLSILFGLLLLGVYMLPGKVWNSHSRDWIWKQLIENYEDVKLMVDGYSHPLHSPGSVPAHTFTHTTCTYTYTCTINTYIQVLARIHSSHSYNRDSFLA